MTMTQNMKAKTYETKLDAFLKAMKALEADGIKMDISIDSTAPKESLELHKEINEINSKLFEKYFDKSSNEFKVNG